jgi:hypothetical protein
VLSCILKLLSLFEILDYRITYAITQTLLSIPCESLKLCKRIILSKKRRFVLHLYPLKCHCNFCYALSFALQPRSSLDSARAPLKAFIVFLDFTHQVDLMLTLQLHLLYKVLLELACIEWICAAFCWWDATLHSVIFTINLFNHHHH